MTSSRELASGEVHIRSFELDRSEADVVRLGEFLSPDELLRADRLRHEPTRRRFITGRGLLREVLSGYNGISPGGIHLVDGDQGKPFIREEGEASWLRFNLSHTGGFALLAVAARQEVGIDVERTRTEIDREAISRRFFSPVENEQLASLPPDDRLHAFFRCWARKEAYIKGCGTGFSQPSNGFDVSLLPDSPPALIGHRAYPDHCRCWNLFDLVVPAGYHAALAVQGEIQSLKYLAV